jgi:retinol dehydrogenase-12
VKKTLDLSGKIVVITGGNTGLGFASACEFAKLDATIVIGCRNRVKAERAIQRIKAVNRNVRIEAIELDLLRFASVGEFCRAVKVKYEKIDVLVCNAGIAWASFAKSEDGIESHFQSNHLGHFLMVNLLMDYVEKCKGRIVSVSSLAHALAPDGINFNEINRKETYDVHRGYAYSKLANIMFTKYLQTRLKFSTAYSVHPGLVLTPNEFDSKLRKMINFFLFPLLRVVMKLPHEGCQTIVYCSACPFSELKPFEYYADCKLVSTTEICSDWNAIQNLWNLSEELTKSWR